MVEKKYLDVPFEVKAEDISDDGIFEGWGSLFDNKPDSYRDLVARGAFQETLTKGGRNGTGIAMLYQHRTDKIPGVWLELKEDPKGLRVKGQLALETQLGREIYEIMKLGAKTGMWRFSLSIGYNTIDSERQEIRVGDAKVTVRLLKKIELFEVSIVSFPAKIGATIDKVKQIQDAKTVRDIERALRDSGFSKPDAQQVIAICKQALRDSEQKAKEAKVADGFSSLLESLKSVNEQIEFKSVIPFHSYRKAPEDERWNASVEIKAADVDDLKQMCTWYNGANPGTKGSYKLPHHKQKGYVTVWRGVANAMARLLQPGTQIPSGERKGVYNHLAKHYKEFDKPVPDFKNYEADEWKEIFSVESAAIAIDEMLENLQEINA